MLFRKVKPGRTFIGRLACGDDLLSSLTGFCRENKIMLGTLQVIGAVRCARFGYYDQRAKRYAGCVSLDEKLEIVSCIGNISIKEGESFVHSHITLADHEGRTWGGHLMEGTAVFAAEFVIRELTGAKLIRVPDPVTGLPLWGDDTSPRRRTLKR